VALHKEPCHRWIMKKPCRASNDGKVNRVLRGSVEFMGDMRVIFSE
jgi:hypothetical protein